MFNYRNAEGVRERLGTPRYHNSMSIVQNGKSSVLEVHSCLKVFNFLSRQKFVYRRCFQKIYKYKLHLNRWRNQNIKEPNSHIRYLTHIFFLLTHLTWDVTYSNQKKKSNF